MSASPNVPGYTCGECEWGRADQPRSLADYVAHVNAAHPTGPHRDFGDSRDGTYRDGFDAALAEAAERVRDLNAVGEVDEVRNGTVRRAVTVSRAAVLRILEGDES